MSTLVEAKRAFYREERVARGYDRQRFGGSSGAYVNARELAIVAELLPARMRSAADVGTGTGRVLPLLASCAGQVLALDASLPMLREAMGRRNPHPSPLPEGEGRFIQADAFTLPLRSGSVETLTCLRVMFHFEDVRPLLRELRRVATPGATLVCDTSTWSPRGLLPLGRRFWGERVAAMSTAKFAATAQRAGWRVREERRCFLISPYIYRRLPLPLCRLLEQLERHLPEPLLCRAFWRLEAAA